MKSKLAPVIAHNTRITRPLPKAFIGGYFDDKTWRVSVPAQGAVWNVNWASVAVDDGSLLEDYPGLFEGAKTYLYLVAQGEYGVREPRGGTLLGYYDACMALVRWMAHRGINGFDELTMAHVIGYRNHVRARFAKTRSRMHIRADNVTNAGLSSGRQIKLLAVLKRLAQLQGGMGKLGTKFTPSEIANLNDLMRVNVKNEPTSAISDEIFRRLLDAALRWLSLEAPKVLQVESLFAQYRETRGGLNDSRRSRARYERLVAPILKDCSSVTLDGVQRNLESLTIQDVARLMTLTRGACFVVIASLTGMRKSEICSLRADCLRSRDIGDGLRVLELKGILYKTVIEQDGQPAEWIAGYDEPHNPVRLAVETLERLPRPARDSALFSAMWQQKADRARISTSVMKMGLRAFVATLGSRNLDVTAHQFRKTFARFVALSSLGSPFTLMRHFKHASILMTERYLCSDPDMLNEIFEAQYEITGERLDSIFGAERLGGIGGKRIVANNAGYRGATNAEARKRLVAMTMSDPSAYFRPTPLGMCLYEESTAKCGGEMKNVGLDACIPCPNFAVHQANLPNWIESRSVLESSISDQSSFGFVSIDLHRQLDQVNRIIAQLESGADGPAT